MMIPPQLLIAGGLLVGGFATGFGAAWEWQSLRADSAALERLESEQKDAARAIDLADKAAGGFEVDRTATRTKFVTITERVDRVIQNPIYRNVCFDDDGLRELAAAVGTTGNTGELAPALPAASAPK